MRTKTRQVLNFEHLEDRLTPTFDPLVFNPATASWMLVQTADSGAVTVQVDAVGDLHLLEGASDINLGVAPANLQVKMLDNSGDLATKILWIDLDSQLAGNLTLTLGNGDRIVGFRGSNNSIGGNLTVTAGTGAQRVNLATATGPAANFSAGGSASIDLGAGDDTVNTSLANGSVSVGSNFTLRGVNLYDLHGTGVTDVGGSMKVYAASELLANTVRVDGGSDVIGTGFSYTGYNTTQVVDLTGATIGSGGVTVNTMNGASTLTLNGTVIGGGLNFTGGSGTERIDSNASTVVGGNISINTGTMGAATVTLDGRTSASSVRVTTGIGNDSVNFSMNGGRPYVSVSLGMGNDTLRLDTGSSLGYLYADFGLDADTYIPMIPYTFPVVLRNLP